MLEDLLRGVVDEPLAGDRWAVLADLIEEYDDPRRAELLRLHRRLLLTCTEPGRHHERAAWQARVVALLAEGVRPCVPRRTVDLGGGVQMAFAFVPPGTFLMGSPPSEPERLDNETQHRVTLTEGFFLGVHQVTQAQWQAVMGGNPSNWKGGTLPVETVSWDDCDGFVKRLSQKTGRRFRLPTESEWEWACRAGTATAFHFGETISTDQANYDGNHTYGKGKKGVYRGKTTPVGSFPPNAIGIHDMHGNVWEWCSDLFGPYPPGESTDPQGASGGDPWVRVLRGGSWVNQPGVSRSACRGRGVPGRRDRLCGCRVVLCLDEGGGPPPRSVPPVVGDDGLAHGPGDG